MYNNAARTNRKAVSSAKSRLNPKSSTVSKEKKEIIPFTFHTTNKGFIAKKKIDNKEKIKKRNVSATFALEEFYHSFLLNLSKYMFIFEVAINNYC